MSKATLIPADPGEIRITRTVVREPQPAKVVLEMTPEDAGRLLDILGPQHRLYDVYNDLHDLHLSGHIRRISN